jgi:hypothetical protein
VKQCSIPSTFDENTAKQMIGERVPGSVQKKQCEHYEFTSKQTVEIITMDYRWVYVPYQVLFRVDGHQSHQPKQSANPLMVHQKIQGKQ